MNFLLTFSRNQKLSRIKCSKNRSLRRSLRESVQIRSFFCSIFFRIRTDYGEILRISSYSVRMRENTEQKKLRIWTILTQ